LISGKQ